jgi:hypothetical protein
VESILPWAFSCYVIEASKQLHEELPYLQISKLRPRIPKDTPVTKDKDQISDSKPRLFLLCNCASSAVVLQVSSISVTWELAKNANSGTSLFTYWIRNLGTEKSLEEE